jgi:uncharacterized OB-fold protein
MPHTSSVPLYWRLNKPRYRLIGTKCITCSSVMFPPMPLCPKCRSRGKLEPYMLKGLGKVISWTVIRVAPGGFEDQVPYAVAMIELDEGTKIAGQIVNGIDGIEIGKKVKAVFRRMYTDGSSGLIHYGLKWEIVD